MMRSDREFALGRRRQKLKPILHLFRAQTGDEPHEPPKFLSDRISLLRSDDDSRMLVLARRPVLVKNAEIRRVVGVQDSAKVSGCG